MLDVLSPCVTFNDHEGSTKSYSYVKDHEEPVSELNLRAALRGHRDRIRARHDAGSRAARRFPASS